jgi:hypothetical protein
MRRRLGHAAPRRRVAKAGAAQKLQNKPLMADAAGWLL